MWTLPENISKFTYKGTDSRTYGIGIKAQNRVLLPEKRVSKTIVDMRSGAVYHNNPAYNERLISLTCIFMADSMYEVRTYAREIAYWLSGSGKLIFSDEPDKYYNARVEGVVDIDDALAVGGFSIVFACNPPFALRPNEEHSISTGVNDVNYLGTAETPCVIILKNTTENPIQNIVINQIRRKV